MEPKEKYAILEEVKEIKQIIHEMQKELNEAYNVGLIDNELFYSVTIDGYDIKVFSERIKRILDGELQDWEKDLLAENGEQE